MSNLILKITQYLSFYMKSGISHKLYEFFEVDKIMFTFILALINIIKF